MKTHDLETLLYSHLYGTGNYITFEMQVPTDFRSANNIWLYGSNKGKERVDACMYSYGNWYFYELKVSVNDFRSKAKKSFQGNYNYFVMPKEIYEKVKDEIADNYKGIGVITTECDERKGYPLDNRLTCVVKPKRQELQVNEEHLKIAFTRSLSSQFDKFWRKIRFNEGNTKLKLRRCLKNFDENLAESKMQTEFLQEMMESEFKFEL